jgi:argininosuccinate lyase
MPGYTHLQRAQPATLGFWLCAWCAALVRDLSWFADALRRLGSGALAGSGLPLDRKAVAEALDFSRITLNAMDAMADRDFALELASACAVTMIHLSRFCEDLVLWANEEFKFLNLSDAWSTDSSIMPQKKNLDFAELIRGKSGRIAGNLAALLTLLKGLPYAYDKDLQEDKEALFDSLDTVRACLRMFRGMISAAVFNTGRMEATDAADYLVSKGMPFHRAHKTAAAIVRDCIAGGKQRISVSLEELKKKSPLFEEDLFRALTPAAGVKARNLSGRCVPAEVRNQIKALRRLAS